MELEEQAKLIDKIRGTLETYLNKKIHINANMGRSKFIENDGILTQVHPRLFILELQGKRGRITRQSYQYVDVLTGMVKLSFEGVPIFEPFIIDPLDDPFEIQTQQSDEQDNNDESERDIKLS